MKNDKPKNQFLENNEYHELLDDNFVNHRRINRSSRPSESQSQHENSVNRSSSKTSSTIKNVSTIQRNGRCATIENGQYLLNDNAHYSVNNNEQYMINSNIRYVVDNKGRYVVNNNRRRSENNKVNEAYDDGRYLVNNKKESPVNNAEYVLKTTSRREVNEKDSSLVNKNSRHVVNNNRCRSVNNNANEKYDNGRCSMNNNAQNVVKYNGEYVVHKNKRSPNDSKKYVINENSNYFENNSQKHVMNDMNGISKTIKNNYNAVCSAKTKADYIKTQKEKEHLINYEKLPKATRRHLQIFNENFSSDDESLSIDTSNDNADKWSTAVRKFPKSHCYIDDNNELNVTTKKPKIKKKRAENISKQNVDKKDNSDDYWKDIQQISILCQKYEIDFDIDPYALKFDLDKKKAALKESENKSLEKTANKSFKIGQKPKEKVVMLPAFYMTKGDDIYYQSETFSWKKLDSCNRFVDRYKDKDFNVDEAIEVVNTKDVYPAYGKCHYAIFPPDTSGYGPYGNLIRPNAKIPKKKYEFKRNDLKSHIRNKLNRPMPWY